MARLENIEAIEKDLWKTADTLRANSRYASNEYFMPVMGLIFLRHAYNRFLKVKAEVEPKLPKRGGKMRALVKEDFSQKNAIFLRPEAQFDYLVGLAGGKDLGKTIITAMELIEADYESLRGVLPKSEYQELSDGVLAQMLRFLNPDSLKRASGDVFGRIYEYFLTQFADLKAHDNGEFFTPASIVSLIARVLEPRRGVVLDPACGSGGMFVQSAHFVEERSENPHQLTFRGMEKNATTIQLAKMNLAVHGLEGDLAQAITYYEDPHEMVGKADFVMANPPFNVDEIDAEKVKRDPRLPFGLPGVNKAEKVMNGNYVWISYFYSYLNERGRAGFVMSSQASSAGRGEAEVRRKLVEMGDVDIMIAIRSNFFYTRTVPCELWFLDRGKPEEHRNKVLMIDARHVYRKVTRKIYDFSPEQAQNLLAIVWLYRGEGERFEDLVAQYLLEMLEEADGCFVMMDEAGEAVEPFDEVVEGLQVLRQVTEPFLERLAEDGAQAEVRDELGEETETLITDLQAFQAAIEEKREDWEVGADLARECEELLPLAETSRDLVRQADLVYKVACRLIDLCEKELGARTHEAWATREVLRARKGLDVARHRLVEQLKKVRYFHKQASWLTERFPDGELRDVPGLVKSVDLEEIAENDWSLTPGRYVGVAPVVEDEDFDFEEALREIHVELEDLNAEAVELAGRIARNFEEMGI